MAPTLLGSGGRPLLALPFTQMREQQRLEILDLRAVGGDWRIDAVAIGAED
jgi:diaminohydroxyphosphoribosylaminopyrimidine deaminase/5-amino-6-(5-phosphoribosylamino)uracil reductase